MGLGKLLYEVGIAVDALERERARQIKSLREKVTELQTKIDKPEKPEVKDGG